MRKISKGGQAACAVDPKSAPGQGVAFAISPEIQGSHTEQALKSGGHASENDPNQVVTQPASAQGGSDVGSGNAVAGPGCVTGISGAPEVVRPLLNSVRPPEIGPGSVCDPPDSGLIANATPQGKVKAPAVAAYLSGFGTHDGDVTLIQRQFFRNPTLWAERRIAELAEKRQKADAYFDGTVPDWNDPVPTGEAQANGWRLYLKAMAIDWERRLLTGHLDLGNPAPASGYKGQRLYHPATDRMAGLLLADVRWQMRIGAPGVWHGKHLVQLAEADWVVTLDHPSVRYVAPGSTVDVTTNPAPVAISRPTYPPGWRPTAAELIAAGWNQAQADFFVLALSHTLAGPVRLNERFTVTDPATWLDKLAIDAMDGPKGARARTKALQNDVRLFMAAMTGKAAA